MQVRTAVALCVAAGLAAAACKTITEDLPTQPTAAPAGGTSNPVLVVVPVAIPSPANPAPTAPPSTQQPAPTQSPTPKPSSSPVNTAPPPSGGGQEGDIPNNSNPVAAVIAKVFFIERNGQIVPNTDRASSALVNDRVHFDCVAKDAKNQPTKAKNRPDWSFEPAGLVKVKDGGSGGYTPAVIMLGRGTVTARVRIDGVTSNTVTVRVD